MRTTSSLLASAIVALAVGLTLTPSAAFAQGMTFDEEDVEPIDEEGMTFDVEDVQNDPAPSGETRPAVGVIAVPLAGLSAGDRQTLQDALRDAVNTIEGIDVYGDADLLPALEDRDPSYCSAESLCLANVGRSAQVDRIVQARVSRAGGSYTLNIDYFDVRDRLFLNYHTISDLSSFSAVLDAVQGGVNEVFGVRELRPEDPGYVERDVNVRRIMAFATAGLSAVSLGTGIFFGLKVDEGMAETEQFSRNDDGTYVELTQRQAQALQRDIESDALTANVFYALSGGLAVTSVLLFVLDSDPAEEIALGDRDQPWYRALRLTPSVSPEAVGMGAKLRF
ncbi:hypothetical protein DL240_13250 [Lujinxingia litoralis]|uniref:DUF5683 domain-containing protein n=1 Tax=Lujinxingia litoralis TaxID=2211119 RepID=A0A328C493_9DELT|nr:hypothetical protein [Lujinxingia litoralis]RAL21812.1 hypothetical protein DL240_13250 [Lujinxingia litoralis]